MSNAKEHSRSLSLDLRNAFGSVYHLHIRYATPHWGACCFGNVCQQALLIPVSPRFHEGMVDCHLRSREGHFPRWHSLSSPVLNCVQLWSMLIQPKGLLWPLKMSSRAALSPFLWLGDEEASDEKPGWYLTKVISNGEMVLRYRCTGETEQVNLASMQ